MTAVSAGPPPSRAPDPSPRWITHPGWWQLLFLGQLAFFGWESFREWHGFWLGHDFAAYWQAVWWIGVHHRLLPPDSVFGFPALANNAEWILLPIGWLAYPLWPHPTVLLILQDGAITVAGWMAWRWVAALTTGMVPRVRWLLLGVTAFLLVGNIWVVRADTFDFHPESLAAVAVLGAARALAERRRWALAGWTLGLLSCGTIGGVLTLGLAGSALLQRQWRPMLAFAATAVLFVVSMGALHWNQGSMLGGTYRYLFLPHPPHQVSALTVAAGVVHHPGRALWALWGNRSGWLLNLLPSGGIGWLSLLVAGPAGLWLLINNLVHPHLGTSFSEPGFQFMPIYALLIVGGLDVIQRRLRHPGRWAQVVGHAILGVAVITTAGLAWIGSPSILIPRPMPPARELTQILRRTPPTQEVIASQQGVGRFGGRPWVYAIMRTQRFPLHTPFTTVVVIPNWGASLLPGRDQQAEVRDLQHNPAARLVAHRDGVWWFVVRKTQATLALPYPRSRLRSVYGFHSTPAAW